MSCCPDVLGAPDPRVRRCGPCSSTIGAIGDLGLGGQSAEYVMAGCENRTALGAYVAAARVEAQVKGALAGALLGGVAVFLFMVTRAPK